MRSSSLASDRIAVLATSITFTHPIFATNAAVFMLPLAVFAYAAANIAHRESSIARAGGKG